MGTGNNGMNEVRIANLSAHIPVVISVRTPVCLIARCKSIETPIQRRQRAKASSCRAAARALKEVRIAVDGIARHSASKRGRNCMRHDADRLENGRRSSAKVAQSCNGVKDGNNMNSSLDLSTEAPKFSGAVGSQARGNGAGRWPATTQPNAAADPGHTGSQDAGASQSRLTGKQAEMRGRGTRGLPERRGSRRLGTCTVRAQNCAQFAHCKYSEADGVLGTAFQPGTWDWRHSTAIDTIHYGRIKFCAIHYF
jgi:hypothetical protein